MAVATMSLGAVVRGWVTLDRLLAGGPQDLVFFWPRMPRANWIWVASTAWNDKAHQESLILKTWFHSRCMPGHWYFGTDKKSRNPLFFPSSFISTLARIFYSVFFRHAQFLVVTHKLCRICVNARRPSSFYFITRIFGAFLQNAISSRDSWLSVVSVWMPDVLQVLFHFSSYFFGCFFRHAHFLVVIHKLCLIFVNARRFQRSDSCSHPNGASYRTDGS
jgi:hypothetical protein